MITTPNKETFDFSSTYYGMLNPLMFNSKYTDFLNEFKEADIPNEAAEAECAGEIDSLITEFYSYINKGSKPAAINAYNKLLNEIAKAAALNSAGKEQAGSVKLRAFAKQIIEEQLGIKIEDELKKCGENNRAESANKLQYIKEKKEEAKKPAKIKKYASKTFETASSIEMKLKFGKEKHSLIPDAVKNSEAAAQSVTIWNKAAAIIGSPKFVIASIALAWAALIYSQFQT